MTAANDITLKVPAPVTIKQPDPNKWDIVKQVIWSLISLIGIPLVLLLVSHEIEKANEATAQNTREAEAVNAYVDSIGSLLLSKDIDRTNASKIEQLIRSKTLLIARQIDQIPQKTNNNPKKDTLDNSRKGQVIRFLYDQELIFSEREIMRREEELDNPQGDNPIFRRVNLGGLDLVNVNLSSAFIPGIDLANTTMKNSNLRNANLVHADLGGADLSNADLSGADLRNTILYATNLQGATYTDDNTPEEICLELGLIDPQSDRNTCPTQFPQGFDVSGQDMAPPLQ